jgi:hypothetical protein
VKPNQIPGPFTPAKLLDIAVEAGDKNADYVWLKHAALACGAWMEKNGHRELPFVGPFGVLPAIPKVRIKKGTRFWTTHPQAERDDRGPYKVAGRTYEVDVNRVSEGSVTIMGRDEGEVTQPSVTWAGAGGYWCEVSLNDVEIVTS